MLCHTTKHSITFFFCFLVKKDIFFVWMLLLVVSLFIYIRVAYDVTWRTFSSRFNVLKHILHKNKVLSQWTEQNDQLQYLLFYIEVVNSYQVKFYFNGCVFSDLWFSTLKDACDFSICPSHFSSSKDVRFYLLDYQWMIFLHFSFLHFFASYPLLCFLYSQLFTYILFVFSC